MLKNLLYYYPATGVSLTEAKMWLNAGLKSDWVIQQINKHKIQNIADLEKYLKKYQGQKVTVIAVRDYNSRKFKVQF